MLTCVIGSLLLQSLKHAASLISLICGLKAHKILGMGVVPQLA